LALWSHPLQQRAEVGYSTSPIPAAGLGRQPYACVQIEKAPQRFIGSPGLQQSTRVYAFWRGQNIAVQPLYDTECFTCSIDYHSAQSYHRHARTVNGFAVLASIQACHTIGPGTSLRGGSHRTAPRVHLARFALGYLNITSSLPPCTVCGFFPTRPANFKLARGSRVWRRGARSALPLPKLTPGCRLGREEQGSAY
jgi:hypothetical protein